VAGEELLRGNSNYFRGNEPSRWLRNVPQYGQLKYENIYRGVDLVTVTMTTSQPQPAALIHKAFRGRAKRLRLARLFSFCCRSGRSVADGRA
jgi:hypothetical protein